MELSARCESFALVCNSFTPNNLHNLSISSKSVTSMPHLVSQALKCGLFHTWHVLRNVSERGGEKADEMEGMTMENGLVHDNRIKAEAELRERQRCLRVCKAFARACYASAERCSQAGQRDDARDFEQRADAAIAIAQDIEREST